MQARDTSTYHNHHKRLHRWIALLICVASVLSMVVTPTLPMANAATKPGPLFSGDIDLNEAEQKENLDNAIHFFIRHWHAAADPNGNESVGDSYTIIVEGYIVPADGDYHIYSRAFNSYYEDHYTDKYDEYAEVTASTVSPYIKLVDGKVQIPMNPYHVGNKYHDRFAGFSVSCGQRAVTLDNGNEKNYNQGAMLIIDPTKYDYTHLVKAHVFYTNELLSVDGEAEMGEGDHKTPFPDYVDTTTAATKSTSKKYYNTTSGLHTDKTACENTSANDGRTFDLDLESWFIDGDPVNVGLILDASGSMGFTAGTPDPIKLTDAQLSALEAIWKARGISSKQFKESDTSAIAADEFLTNEELALILNPHNTDNSQLRSSGYSYYIFDSRSSTQEFVPLGYWEGGIPQASSLIGHYAFSSNDGHGGLLNTVTGDFATAIQQQTLETGVDFSLGASSDATPTLNSNRLVISSSSSVGIKLDAMPTSENFTVSFSVEQASSGDVSTAANQNIADLLYIGALSGQGGNDSDYFRLVRREGSSRNRLRASNGISSPIVANFNSVFGNTNKSIVTCVFNGGTVKTYVYKSGAFLSGSNVGTESGSVNLSDLNIVLNAFNSSYNGANLFIDDLYVFDTALTDTEVKRFMDIQQFGTNTGTVPAYAGNGDVLGAVTGSQMASTPLERVGWYYINPVSRWKENYVKEGLESCKTLNGIQNGYTFTDTIPQQSTSVDVPFGGTGRTYTSNSISPTKFYIDKDGYLRCFYWVNSTDGYGTSYVYENGDTSYIKVEALQRALGSFVTELEAQSPASLVSAVRFSTSDANLDPSMLVLSDWTSNVREAQQILSNQRGEGGTIQGTSSEGSAFCTTSGLDGIEQYNYGLTGNTSTVQGLKAFQSYLDPRLTTYESATKQKGLKYLIIFTDGVDTDLPKAGNNPLKTEAYTVAEELKAAGYTIFCVLLAGGPAVEGTANYDNGIKFLTALSGSAGQEPYAPEKKNYVYSTEDPEVKSAAGNSIDALIAIFNKTGGILNKIANNLDDYNVQDYIDPRFDLVDVNNGLWRLNKKGNVVVEHKVGGKITDADGNVWNLNANGKISLENRDGEIIQEYDLRGGKTVSIPLFKDSSSPNAAYTVTLRYNSNQNLYYYQLDLSGGKTEPIALSQDSGLTSSAWNATLHYDSDKDMYYLVWTGQTIPGSSYGASKTPIWRGRVTVRAKDDYIGGNATLSNGNAANQNYVYDPDDPAPSSGIDKSYGKKKDSPSKGFPRTTVNVMPKDIEKVGGREVYMGEELSSQLNVVRELVNDTKGSVEYYYWEYLERYVNYYNELVRENNRIKQENQGKSPSEQEELLTLPPLPEKITVVNGLTYATVIDPGENNEMDIEDLYAALLSDQLQLPYCYLPDTAEKNQTGGREHKVDVFGYIKYSTDKADGFEEYPDKDGQTSTNTQSRSISLSVSYSPISADDRVERNEWLVVEEDRNNHDIYGWDKVYKETAGIELTDSNVPQIEGNHTTTIVSGDIVLQMQVKANKINQIIGYLDKPVTAVYKADLYRTYTVGSEAARTTREAPKKEKVGTYSVTYSITGKMTQDETVTASISLDSDFAIDVAKNGLPIGTYTLEKSSESTTGTQWLKFGDIDAVTITADDNTLFVNDNVKTDPSKEANANDFAAPASGNTAHLGMNTPQGESYIDSLYALFKVDLEPIDAGNLKIAKTVLENGSKTEEFGFTILLTLPDGYEDFDLNQNDFVSEHVTALTFSNLGNGQWSASITLCHDTNITIKDLPKGTTFTVTESDDKGYKLKEIEVLPTGITVDLEAKSASGVIEKDITSMLTFSNLLSTELPNVGGMGTGLFYLGGALLVLSALAMLFYRKRKISLQA